MTDRPIRADYSLQKDGSYHLDSKYCYPGTEIIVEPHAHEVETRYRVKMRSKETGLTGYLFERATATRPGRYSVASLETQLIVGKLSAYKIDLLRNVGIKPKVYQSYQMEPDSTEDEPFNTESLGVPPQA